MEGEMGYGLKTSPSLPFLSLVDPFSKEHKQYNSSLTEDLDSVIIDLQKH